MLVLNAAGELLAANRLIGSPWHGCRAIDVSGGTLMFAEYPYERPHRAKDACRVFRSRDRGRSWNIVFEQPPTAIRHFHFLQARPGDPREWWLTSGDLAEEVHIWISRDDGDNWTELAITPNQRMVADGVRYPRSLFCLTDLAWFGNEAVWGIDDVLRGNRGDTRGAKVLRMAGDPELTKQLVGTARFPIRNIVDVGKYWLFLTQGSLDPAANPEQRRPAVYLLTKRHRPGSPQLVHLFDVDTYSPIPTAFTYSKASRAARNGVFFTARSGTDLFPCGHRLLKWELTFS